VIAIPIFDINHTPTETLSAKSFKILPTDSTIVESTVSIKTSIDTKAETSTIKNMIDSILIQSINHCKL